MYIVQICEKISFPFLQIPTQMEFMDLVFRKNFEIAKHGKSNSVDRIKTSKFYQQQKRVTKLSFIYNLHDYILWNCNLKNPGLTQTGKHLKI